MKIKFSILFLLMTSIAVGQKYELNTSKSLLKWTGKDAFSAYSLSGTLKASNGSLQIRENQLQSGLIIINMKTLSSEIKDLTKHLRGKDFFEVKKYTKASFVLTSPIDLNQKNTTATGNLTIKKQTKLYSFPISLKKEGDNYRLSGTITINRTDFGIFFNSPNYFENIKQNAISDEFLLVLDIVFEATTE